MPVRMVVLLTAAMVATGCGVVSDEQEPAMETIRGTVIYLEGVALPPAAKVSVEIQDVSRADAPARVLASTRFEAEGGPPYPFRLSYDPDRVDTRMRYALGAAITLGDKLLFTTDPHHPAFRIRKIGNRAGALAGQTS